MYNRYRSGEMVSADSIVVNDSLKYFTKVKQRPVYGGGGIIPDVFVPLDTTISYLYFNRLIAKNVIGEFIANYIDKNRDQLKKKYPDMKLDVIIGSGRDSIKIFKGFETYRP